MKGKCKVGQREGQRRMGGGDGGSGKGGGGVTDSNRCRTKICIRFRDSENVPTHFTVRAKRCPLHKFNKPLPISRTLVTQIQQSVAHFMNSRYTNSTSRCPFHELSLHKFNKLMPKIIAVIF